MFFVFILQPKDLSKKNNLNLMEVFKERVIEVTKITQTSKLFVIYMGVVMTLADYIDMRDSL